MNIAAQIGRQVLEKETSLNARCFSIAAKYIALGKAGGLGEALRLAERARALPPSPHLKAVVDAGGTSGTWGDQLAATTGLSNAFLQSLRTLSIFEAMRPFSPEVPFSTRIVVVSSGATGTTVNEAMVKPISKVSLTAADTDLQKSLAIVVLTEELLRSASITLFQTELQRAVAAAVDAAFIAKIISGISPTSSGGDALEDIAAGVAGLTLDAGSKVFCATSPAIVKELAFLRTSGSTNQRAFPELTINGGNLSGVEFFPTSGVSGQLVFFDASQIAHAQRGIELDVARHASVQMDTAPDSPQTAATPAYRLPGACNLIGVSSAKIA